MKAVTDRPKIVIEDEELSSFNESINIWVYGNYGVGKTVLIGDVSNAESAKSVTWLTTEKGIVAAKRVGHTGRVWRAPSWPHVEAAIDRADAELGENDWLLVDSANKMQTLLHLWWLGKEHAENEARDEDIPQIQDYQKFQNMFKRFITHLVDAPYNCIFTSTAMTHEDPEGENIVLPAIIGKGYEVANYCAAEMDQVLYYGMARQTDRNAPAIRRLLSETFPPWHAKDRYRVLPRWLDVEEDEFDVMSWIVDEIMKIPAEQRQAMKAAG